MARAKKTVLFLVDDEPQVLRALERIFANQGYQIYAFESALAARRELSRKHPTLVVSDNYMPKVSGLEFLREIRHRFPKVRTILLTGGFISDEIKSAVATGEVDTLIQKPWDLPHLVVSVREHLAKSSAT